MNTSNTGVVYDFTIPALAPWSGLVKRGQVIRIVDLEGQQAVDFVLRQAPCEVLIVAFPQSVLDEELAAG